MSEILTINTGSSSLKIALYEREDRRLLTGSAERIGGSGGRLRVTDAHGSELLDQPSESADHGHALAAMLDWLYKHRPKLNLVGIGHRVVHGGVHYHEHQRISPELIANLQNLVPMAPNHLPQAILTMQATLQKYPGLLQVACFDTSFHRQMPRIAQIYPLPRQFTAEGIIRYGFHGISYEYILQQLRTLSPLDATGRVIIAHLGNGASLAAVRDGKSLDTTMGFTPAGGLMMGTRTGDLDPGVLIHLLTTQKLAPDSLNELVNKKSGLIGVSETSEDMRDLLQRESTDERAAEAVALFCYQAKKYLGALTAILGGLDTLVFTGGIGEHADPIRSRITNGLDFLGIRLDPQRNEKHAPIISQDTSSVTVRVIKTDEECILAQAIRHFLSLSPIQES